MRDHRSRSPAAVPAAPADRTPPHLAHGNPPTRCPPECTRPEAAPRPAACVCRATAHPRTIRPGCLRCGSGNPPPPTRRPPAAAGRVAPPRGSRARPRRRRRRWRRQAEDRREAGRSNRRESGPTPARAGWSREAPGRRAGAGEVWATPYRPRPQSGPGPRVLAPFPWDSPGVAATGVRSVPPRFLAARAERAPESGQASRLDGVGNRSRVFRGAKISAQALAVPDVSQTLT